VRFQLGYRNIKRLNRIVAVLIKHGFYPLLERLHLSRLVSIPQKLKGKKAMREGEGITEAARLRSVFEDLGPSFIKLGQLLSTRSDLFPEEYIKELLKLLDEVPPFGFDEVINIIEAELKSPAMDIFKKIDAKPLAAASIAQVHSAETMAGEKIVIKVQRPGIEEVIEADISVMTYLARLIEHYIPESRLWRPVELVEEFSTAIRKEMDFTLEASYMEKFSRMFSKDKKVVIPKVYWNCTSKRVITMQRIEGGIRADDVEALRREGIDTEELAHLLTDMFFQQVFEFGIFHGDLHAGNIFVLGPDKVALVDFGIVGWLDDDMAENLADVFVGVIKEDYDLITKVFMRMGVVSDDIDKIAFKRDYHDLFLRYFGRPLENTSFGELMVDYMKLSAKHNIKLPSNLLLLNRCIVALEGLGRLLHPEINILKESQQHAAGLIRKRMSPSSIAGNTMETIMDYQKLTKNFPSKMERILDKFSAGNFAIDFFHKGLEDFMGEIDRSSNRLTVGIIIAALIVGSALVLAFGGGPELFGYPILGILGFTTAGFLGLWLAIFIIKSRKF